MTEKDLNTGAAGTESNEVKLTDLGATRGYRYVEMFTVGPEYISIYNSTVGDETPLDVWAAFDAAVAAENRGVAAVIKNGPHWWAMDGADWLMSVDVTNEQGIDFRFGSKVPAAVAKEGKLEPPFYTPVPVNKVGELRYLAGKTVCELVSPDGEAFVMQSSSFAPEKWATLGEDLTLPEGWEYRVRTLEEDLIIKMDGKVMSVMDEFKDLYNLPPA